MNRREFLDGLRRRAAALGAVSAVAATGAIASGRELVDRSVDTMQSQIKDLNKRLDEMDARHKKTIKILIALTGISLGMDISHFL
jgi:hypothetical protein